MKVVDKLHNLSLHVLTLCGVGAVVSLTVNVCTAAVMFLMDHFRKKEQ